MKKCFFFSLLFCSLLVSHCFVFGVRFYAFFDSRVIFSHCFWSIKIAELRMRFVPLKMIFGFLRFLFSILYTFFRFHFCALLFDLFSSFSLLVGTLCLVFQFVYVLFMCVAFVIRFELYSSTWLYMLAKKKEKKNIEHSHRQPPSPKEELLAVAASSLSSSSSLAIPFLFLAQFISCAFLLYSSHIIHRNHDPYS